MTERRTTIDRFTLWYSMAFDFHLRPSREVEMSSSVHYDHFLIEDIFAKVDFAVWVTLRIGGRELANRVYHSNLVGPLLVPFDMAKADVAEVRIENASLGTRKWNRGQLVLHGRVWN
jgi:hypothetical protein